MKKFTLVFICILTLRAFSQGGYDIKISIKNFPDSMAYLAKFNFGKQYLVDTCKKISNGNIVFKGKRDLDKGVYFLVSQKKSHVFDFFINENSKLNITSDAADIQLNLHSKDSKENEDFFNYTRFFISKNKEFSELKNKTKGMNKADSIKFMQDNAKKFTEEVVKYESDILTAQKGTFFGDWLNLKTEKEAKELPKLKNANDSAYYRFNYYKNHYWDGINWADDRLLRTQFLEDRVKKYFDQIVLQLGPDTINAEIDKILSKCPKQGEMFKYLFVHFMVNFENHKLMGFDKVFVHLTDTYVKSGDVKGIYDAATIEKIIEKSERIKPLLIGKVAPELMLIDTINGKIVNKMGFDTASTAESITKLYYANAQKLAPMFKTLSSVKAKYTILVFWDVECSHCKTEIPKLLEIYHKLKKEYDVQVMSVYTLTEFDKWRKYIIDNKLDFINVYDPVYINNIKNKYDVFSTPKLYLLDKNKVIRSKHIPVDKIEEMMKMHDEEDKLKN